MSRIIGQNHENAVVEFFRRSGWHILCQNYYTVRGEVDILAQFIGLDHSNVTQGEVAIIEVKYRKCRSSWSIDLVPNRKRLALCRVARVIEEALMTGEIVHPIEISGYQFVLVLVEGTQFQIVWNAFDDILG